MKMTNQVAVMLSALTMVSACGSSEDVPRAEPPPVEETVFREMVGTMDKACSVEDTTMQRTEQLNEALEASESR